MKYLVSMLPVVSVASAVSQFAAGNIVKGIAAVVMTAVYVGIASIVWVVAMEDKKLKQKGI